MGAQSLQAAGHGRAPVSMVLQGVTGKYGGRMDPAYYSTSCFPRRWHSRKSHILLCGLGADWGLLQRMLVVFGCALAPCTHPP